MPDLILHHYPTSPFSEKIRLILGFKKLRWQSVIIPTILPKPDVVALTGGYRKTPILQIGADIYCDTALIADVIEELHPTPTLYPHTVAGEARTLAQWADSTLFWTMIPFAMQPAGLQALFASVPPAHVQAFGVDRRAFRNNAPRMPLPEATGALQVYLHRLDAMLHDGRPYLLGAQPTIADFSVYHSLWFIRRTGALAAILDPHPQLHEWMEHVRQTGHGESTELSSADAVAVARDGAHASLGQLAFCDHHAIALGERVRVAATDYGTDPVEGELVICAQNEVGVRRSDPRAGDVIVHFPRVGFAITRLE
ncbi:MAG: glutathione S-transferase family protein [Casimicrobiaceae bacterium]